ncbi:MAG TPA: TfoX/Sxy family protein [Rhizomicrobium sp.]|jgi:DNA transformation protein|nr:TfoX/Sxy family protein [Rhizomicrobium sp.]
MPGEPDRFDDLFAPFGKIAVRRMFGAEGLFRDGLMFGIVYQERIYFKTSDESRQTFMAEGAKPLYYRFKNAEGVLTSYYELPDRLYDDPEELADWARTAFAVARNAPAAKKKRKAVQKRVGKKTGRPAKKRR